MRLLRVGCLVLAPLAALAPAWAQDAPQLFAPAPNTPPVPPPDGQAPRMRTGDVPVPMARPLPEIRKRNC